MCFSACHTASSAGECSATVTMATVKNNYHLKTAAGCLTVTSHLEKQCMSKCKCITTLPIAIDVINKTNPAVRQ